MLSLARAREIDVAVMDLRDRTNASVVPVIQALRADAPWVRVIVRLEPMPAAFREAPAASAAGAAEFAIRRYDRLDDLIRRVMAPGWRPAAGQTLLEAYLPRVPEHLVEFAVICALKGSARLTPELVADLLRMSVRTLRDHLARAFLAPVSVWIRYAAARHATRLLGRHGVQPAVVAERLGFGSVRSLSKALKQYTGGKSATQIREHGGYDDAIVPADQVLGYSALLERYVNDELTAEERVQMERSLATAPPEFGELLESLRRSRGESPGSRAVGEIKREVWEKLRKHLRI